MGHYSMPICHISDAITWKGCIGSILNKQHEIYTVSLPFKICETGGKELPF